jgi:hypothetical protein
MKEFTGNLRKIKPDNLMKKDMASDYDSFFLVLALIYNDLKDLLYFSNTFHKEHRQPALDGTEEPSPHLGEWSAVNDHLMRLMVSFISEFLIFLEKNMVVIKTIQFMAFEQRLPIEVRNDWNNIIKVLNDKKPTDFLSRIARVRSNIAFHYDQSLKELRSGFVDHFFDSPKNKYNQKAFYSLGDSMETTRFYYADAAAGAFLKKQLLSSGDYYKETKDLVKKMNTTISYMLQSYLKEKSKNI